MTELDYSVAAPVSLIFGRMCDRPKCRSCLNVVLIAVILLAGQLIFDWRTVHFNSRRECDYWDGERLRNPLRLSMQREDKAKALALRKYIDEA